MTYYDGLFVLDDRLLPAASDSVVALAPNAARLASLPALLASLSLASGCLACTGLLPCVHHTAFTGLPVLFAG